VYTVDLADLQQSGTVMGARLVVRDTQFDYQYADDYQAMISALAADPARNQLIAKDVIQYVQRSSPPALVVSDRKAQCHQIAELIRKAGIATAVLTGELSAKRRQQIVSDLAAGKVPVLVSTIQLIGEGFDHKNLSALFLATPVRYPARLQQVVGRILRSQHGKQTPLIYDYQDRNGILQASFHSRLQTYQRMGIDAGPN
jgi:superfamily II DNA or RNA helicase